MNRKAVFVTATGTDIGKTYVSGLLVKKMRDLDFDCGYYKPALSGAIKQPDGSLLPGDCDFVVKTSGLKVNPTDCVTYCFEEAVSPHLAANRLGVEICLDKIKSEFLKNTKKYDYLVVEGAGGITCPFVITDKKVVLLPQIIKNLGLDVVIIADGGLGTINSVLLTVEYAKAQGLGIRGIILNNYIEKDFMYEDNKAKVERLTGVKVIATVKKDDKDLNISQENLLKIFE